MSMTDLLEKQLGAQREKIDAIDVQILTLLAKRAEHVLEVGRIKHANGIEGSFIRSGREARMMREILEKGAGNFPNEALFTIWRTIIAASLKTEGGLQIVMPRTKSFNAHNLISGYFGAFSDYAVFDSVTECLDAINGHTVGVFNATDNWWTLNLKDIKVFAKLHDEMFALAKIKPEECGEDKTLIVSKHEIAELPHIATQNGLFLYELDGYFTDESEIEYADVRVLGSYA